MDVFDKFFKKISYKFSKGYPDLENENDVLLLESLIKKYTDELEFELNEVNLKPVDLEKPFPPRHELYNSNYKDRGERFLEKIKNNDEFQLTNGNYIVIDPIKSKEAIKLLINKKYRDLGRGKIFYDEEGNNYSFSDFNKTKEFGSGSGQGGGSANTAIQESSQCLFCALTYEVKKGKISEDDLTQENFEKAFKYCDVTSTLEEMINYSQDESWKNSMILTANIIFENIKNPSFTFHRGSKFVNKIYSAFRNGLKEEGFKMANDKWNPSDIWLVDSSILDYEFSDNINDLNFQLNELFNDNKLIGISLKKLGKEGSLKVINNPIEKIKTTYKGYSATPTNKQVDILYDDGKITFRTFNFAANFAGEIMGKKAAHGKIGNGPLNKILRNYKLNELPFPKTLKQNLESNDKKTIDEFYSIYHNFVEKIDKDAFIKLLNNKEIDWKVSKFSGLKLLVEIETLDDEERNNIISDIISFASSIVDVSSVFVKIS